LPTQLHHACSDSCGGVDTNRNSGNYPYQLSDGNVPTEVCVDRNPAAYNIPTYLASLSSPLLDLL